MQLVWRFDRRSALPSFLFLSFAYSYERSTVSAEYFGHLDMGQRRTDIDERPELRLGSVDFAVGKEYWVQDSAPMSTLPPRVPAPLCYVFAIDISWTSGRCGLVQEVVNGLKELLYPVAVEGRPIPPTLPVGAKIAIMTFDKTVQFYNLKVKHLPFVHSSLRADWRGCHQ